MLRNDVSRPVKRGLNIRHFLFRCNILLSHFLQILVRLLKKNQIGKRFQAPLLRKHRSRSAFRSIRQIEILDFNHRLSRANLRLKLRCQLSLLPNRRKHLLLLFLQTAQIFETLIKISQHLII